MRFLAPLMVVLLACQGSIGEPGGAPSPDRVPDDDDGDGIPDILIPAPSGLRRLSAPQYTNSVHDLLGDAIVVPTDLEPDTAVNGFVSVGSAQTTISNRGVEQYEAAAFEVAGQVISDPVARAAILPCTPTGPADEACLRQLTTDFGLRAWRRPLSTAEIDRYTAAGLDAATTLGSFDNGVELVIAGLLQSPYFLFRTELGAGGAYDDWEMASRLSYFFWNSTPDAQLLDAAAAGELTTDAGLRAQAERLAASERSRGAVREFFAELLDITELQNVSKDRTLYPAFTDTLGASMKEGTLATIEHLVFEARVPYPELFTTRVTYANPELARIYGVAEPPSGGFEQLVLPPESGRVGLLGQASFLARNSHPTATSPTLRGKFVRTGLLCQDIPAPPDDVGELPEPSPELPTMRERLEIHRQNAACASCHALMDPIGLGLENFDAIGAYRETENDVTIDASGDLDGTLFADGAGLGAALSTHDDLGPCLVRNFYRFATGHIEMPGEERAILLLARAFEEDGELLQALAVELVMSEGFRRAGAPR